MSAGGGHTAGPKLAPVDIMEGKTLLHIETRHDHPAGAGVPVCSMPKSMEWKAKEIVRAVNNHDALLDALRALLKHAGRDPEADDEAIAAYEAARKAIASAEGR